MAKRPTSAERAKYARTLCAMANEQLLATLDRAMQRQSPAAELIRLELSRRYQARQAAQ